MRVELRTGWGGSVMRGLPSPPEDVVHVEKVIDLAAILALCPDTMLVEVTPNGLKIESYTGFLE